MSQTMCDRMTISSLSRWSFGYTSDPRQGALIVGRADRSQSAAAAWRSMLGSVETTDVWSPYDPHGQAHRRNARQLKAALAPREPRTRRRTLARVHQRPAVPRLDCALSRCRDAQEPCAALYLRHPRHAHHGGLMLGLD